MKVLKLIGLLAIVIVSIAGVGLSIESEVHVDRVITIEAKPKKIMKHLIDFRKFNTWSPWTAYDSNCKYSYSEKQSKVGATYNWEGNEEVGVGSMEILEISRTKVVMDLIYTAPWHSESVVYYVLGNSDNGTVVNWGYDGKMSLLSTIFIDMDAVLGADYEKGLRSLKEMVE